MKREEVKELVKLQKDYFASGATLSPEFRVEKLKELKASILAHEEEINAALYKDLGKSASESYMTEVGMVLEELTCMIKKAKKWSKARRVSSPLAQFPSYSYQLPSPYGLSVILSPWNYPFMLTLTPLVDALAAGNTAIIKPSSTAIHTAEIIKKIISKVFHPQYVSAVVADHDVVDFIINENPDYIFFTGSPSVGRNIYTKAAKMLIPITLELGGKSPCIVDDSADIKLAAKRIVFGKFLNCGQTCVAPDFVYCSINIKNELLAEMKKQIVNQYGPDPLKTSYYGKIISDKHYARLKAFAKSEKRVYGGKVNEDTHQIEPTLLDNVTFDDAIMNEEIFGPILPILTFKHENEAIAKLKTLESPLASYVFSKDKENINRFTSSYNFGGGCVNDTIIHLATTEMGFGGVGQSGMGAYHGKTGFDTFSHLKSIVKKSTLLDLPFRYAPYTKCKNKLIRMFLK